MALRRLGIRCDAARQDLVAIASRGSDIRGAAPRIRRAPRRGRRERAGWRQQPCAVMLSIEEVGAIKTDATAFDPYRAGIGLIAAAVKEGAQVFERSPVARIRPGRHKVDVTTDAGSVTAEPRRRRRPLVDRRSPAAAPSLAVPRRIWGRHGAARGAGAAAGRSGRQRCARGRRGQRPRFVRSLR